MALLHSSLYGIGHMLHHNKFIVNFCTKSKVHLDISQSLLATNKVHYNKHTQQTHITQTTHMYTLTKKQTHVHTCTIYKQHTHIHTQYTNNTHVHTHTNTHPYQMHIYLPPLSFSTFSLRNTKSISILTRSQNSW